MSSTLRSPRLNLVDPLPLRMGVQRPGLADALFGGLAVLGGLVAIASEGTLYRGYMGLFGVLSLVVLMYLRSLAGAAAAGFVRVADVGLRFVRKPSVAALPVVVAIVAMIPGSLSLLAPAWTGENFGLSGGVGPMILWAGATTLGGAVWLVMQMWASRLPAGLSLTERGLAGVRGGADARAPWELVESATVESGGAGLRLIIVLTDGSAIALQAHEIGSDPNLVAVIIEHFRKHPEDRDALNDASEALRRVEAAQPPPAP